MNLSDPESYAWKQTYAGLGGQAAGYLASSAYRVVVNGESPLDVALQSAVPFLASAAAEVASAPLVALADAATDNDLAKAYASTAASAVIGPAVFALSNVKFPHREPALVLATVDPTVARISTAPARDAVSAIMEAGPLAGSICSAYFKLAAAALSSKQISGWQITESVWVGLTRGAVLGNAHYSTEWGPLLVAGAMLAADAAALSAQAADQPIPQALLYSIGSGLASFYIGSLQDNDSDKPFISYGLFLLGTGAHTVSATTATAAQAV